MEREKGGLSSQSEGLNMNNPVQAKRSSGQKDTAPYPLNSVGVQQNIIPLYRTMSIQSKLQKIEE